MCLYNEDFSPSSFNVAISHISDGCSWQVTSQWIVGNSSPNAFQSASHGRSNMTKHGRRGPQLLFSPSPEVKNNKKVKNIKTRLDVLDNKKIRRGLSLAIVLNNRQTGSISLRCLSPSVPRTKENIPAGIQFCDWTEKRYVWAAIIGFSGEFNIQISGKLKRRWFMDAQSCCRVPKLI